MTSRLKSHGSAGRQIKRIAARRRFLEGLSGSEGPIERHLCQTVRLITTVFLAWKNLPKLILYETSDLGEFCRSPLEYEVLNCDFSIRIILRSRICSHSKGAWPSKYAISVYRNSFWPCRSIIMTVEQRVSHILSIWRQMRACRSQHRVSATRSAAFRVCCGYRPLL